VLVDRRPEELAAAEAMVAAAARAYGRLDGVVTAAGLNRVGLIVDQDPAEWDEVQRATCAAPGWSARRPAGG
jgi:NAD(P)-dependent dehydrogenase (short-subunit alcohol dehydrogenase family)